MEVRIMNNREAAELLDREPGRHDALLIVDPKEDLNEPPFFQIIAKANEHLILEFQDCVVEYAGYQPPTTEQMAAAMKWGEGRESVIVCCEGGVGRSPAVGYLMKVASGADPRDALSVLRPYHYPNGMAIEIGSKLLKKGMVQACIQDFKEQAIPY